MKRKNVFFKAGILLLSLLLLPGMVGRGAISDLVATPTPTAIATPTIGNADAEVLQCVAFSPYVAGYDPELGPHPPPSLINTLLDVIVYQAGFRCIMTYGVLNGLDYAFEAAKNRGMKVIAIVWLDGDPSVDEASITLGIQKASQYPDTIIRISCGSEVRLRHGVTVAEPIIRNCIQRFKTAGVTQPIGYIDTWWEWCNATWPCQQWTLANDVDWIGINVFPWWENKYSGLFPCTTASQAPGFHIARLRDLIARYPQKDVLLTEFGWPACPDGYSETNQYTGERCGVASEANQFLVVEGTLSGLEQLGLSGVVFVAFREPWKADQEGPVGPCWGICEGTPPYTCKFPYGFRERLYLPLMLR